MTTATLIWRDYVTDGLPSTGVHKPKKGEVRVWGSEIEAATAVAPERFGAPGDGVSDVAAGLNSINVPHIAIKGIYVAASAVTWTEDIYRLEGAGWFLDKDNTPFGSWFKSDATTPPADLITIQSATPGSGESTRVDGLSIRDLGFWHTGTGTALVLDNVIRTQLENIRVRCAATGAFGIHLKDSAYFASLSSVHVEGFTATGILIEGNGTQHILRDVSAISSAAGADIGIEIRNPDFLIDGGQQNISATGAGIGVLVNNVGVGNLHGGTIQNTICETDIGVKITGTTKEFREVIVDKPYMSGLIAGSNGKFIVFDRARDCIMRDPMGPSPSLLGALAEWTALSVNCGVECTQSMVNSVTLTVNASATDPWLRVKGTISDAARQTITSATNLLVICDNVDGIGPSRRINNIWTSDLLQMSDDTAASFSINCYQGGKVRIFSDRDPDSCGEVYFESGATGAIVASTGGAKFTVDATSGTLAGTTGTDGNVTVRYDQSGELLYLENRSGAFASFKYEIAGIID